MPSLKDMRGKAKEAGLLRKIWMICLKAVTGAGNGTAREKPTAGEAINCIYPSETEVCR